MKMIHTSVQNLIGTLMVVMSGVTAKSVGSPCSCDKGVLMDSTCYNSVNDAFTAASSGDTIYLGGRVEVDHIIKTEKDLTVIGKSCELSGSRAKLVGTFHSATNAMIMATSPKKQTFVFENLDITSSHNGNLAAFHSLGTAGGEGTTQNIDMTLKNVRIHNMRSEVAGTGIYIGMATQLTVDKDCEFDHLEVRDDVPDEWAGGAAIGLRINNGEVNIAGHFHDNKVKRTGSNHASGGAIWMANLSEGAKLTITAKFERNEANQAGAVQLWATLKDSVYMDKGTYRHNIARDAGNGARFGAVGIMSIGRQSHVTFAGKYEFNVAEGRGGAIGTNNHVGESLVEFTGSFKGNKAQRGGAWSAYSTQTFDGKAIWRKKATVSNNKSDESYNNLFNVAQLNKSVSEKIWKGRHDDDLIIQSNGVQGL